MTIHIVKSGETLFSIAREYSVDLNILAINNGITGNRRLAIGQSLIVVFPQTTHIVQQGETLFTIAQKYGISVNQIYRNNLILKGIPIISPGLQLTITTDSEIVGSYMTGGYAYPFIDITLLNTTLPFMSGVMPFTYGFNEDGSLVMLNDNTLVARAKTYGTRPVMHLSTLTEEGNFSVELAESFLNNRDVWDTLIDNVLINIRQKGYYALDIDFEFLGAANAANYAAFVGLTRNRLNSQGYPVLVALAPKTRVDQPGILYEGHDYRALGNAANTVLLMTYEWGYTFGPPMAVSPIKQVSAVIEFALTQIDNNKIFLGISNYGYDFTLPYVQGESKAPSLSTIEANALAAQYNAVIIYDEEAQAPYFRYYVNGTQHIVWYEDVRSLQARLQLLKQYDLRGALYWNLDRPNPQNLVLLNSMFNILPLNLF
ncbi:MAG: glycosyl hydrolase family 18 protein [Eubacteriales bacterium]